VLTEELRFDYVISFRGNIKVTAADSEERTALGWVGPGGRATVLRGAMVTADQYEVGAVLCVRDKDMKGAWCLATSYKDATAGFLKGLYGKRWGIECAEIEHHQTPYAFVVPARLHALRPHSNHAR
jgi:hypothetical protein